VNLKLKELTAEEFSPYGTFFDMAEGYTQDPISFIPDRMLHYIGSPSLSSVSSIRLRYRPLKVDIVEYHDDCEEVFGGFNQDIVFHVGLLGPENKPAIESSSLFKLPKGCFARVKRKVLHHAGFVLGKDDVADGIVLLPPAAYTIDCHVLEIDPQLDLIID